MTCSQMELPRMKLATARVHRGCNEAEDDAGTCAKLRVPTSSHAADAEGVAASK